MLHALSSTFTTCACGSKAKDCALNLMAKFVNGCLPVPAPPLPQRPNDLSTTDTQSQQLDLGPLVGAQRGFHTREKSPLNGGMNGVEMIPDQFTGPSDQHATVDTTELSEKENDLRLDHFDGSFPKVQTISASTSASPSPPPPVTSIQVEEDRSRKSVSPLHQISARHIPGVSSPMLLAVRRTARHHLRTRTLSLSQKTKSRCRPRCENGGFTAAWRVFLFCHRHFPRVVAISV